jgi:hypothetical protein
LQKQLKGCENWQVFLVARQLKRLLNLTSTLGLTWHCHQQQKLHQPVYLIILIPIQILVILALRPLQRYQLCSWLSHLLPQLLTIFAKFYDYHPICRTYAIANWINRMFTMTGLSVFVLYRQKVLPFYPRRNKAHIYKANHKRRIVECTNLSILYIF